MNEIEQNVWRTVRAITILAVLVVLLLVGISVINMVDRSLTAGAGRQPYEPIGAGVRVQSYAEIVPAPGGQTAHAWALGPDQQGNMSSNTIASEQQVSAAAQSVWPRVTPGTIAQGRSALGDKAALPVTPASPEAPGAVQPSLLIQIPLANLREGPGTEYPILGVASEGARYLITARYGDWWQVQTRGGVAWVHSALGAMEGDAGSIPSAVVVPGGVVAATDGALPGPQRGTLAPVAVATVAPASLVPTAAPTRLPTYGYSVETTRHPEANTVVIYALIQDNQAIVGDLYLSVEHNGQRWRSEASSYAVQGVTKPSEPGSSYNRTYNAKIDFPRFLFPVLDVTGDWAITLVDGLGQPLSAITTITIAPDDPQREIYLYYRKVKL